MLVIWCPVTTFWGTFLVSVWLLGSGWVFLMVGGGGVEGVVSRGVRTLHGGDVRVKLAP